jgi:hypothetical protein
LLYACTKHPELKLFSSFGRDPIDQNTGNGGLEILEDEDSLIGNDLEKNKRIEGRRGSARFKENNKADEKAKAERKSRIYEWLG